MPSTFSSAKRGAKTSTTIKVAKTMEPRISLLARNTTCSVGSLSSSGRAAFWRRRRTTFSTSIRASSTNAPIAIAIPPKVMPLMDKPRAFNPINVVPSENGIANSAMTLARQLPRNTTTTTTTSRPPKPSASSRFEIAVSTKSA